MMKQPNLQDYIKWDKPFSPYEAPLPTDNFWKGEAKIEIIQLEINHHWLMYKDEQGYFACKVILPDGTEREFEVKETVEGIVKIVKDYYQVDKVFVHYNYNWEVL